MDMDPAIVELSAQLAKTAIHNSATAIIGRVGDAKNRRRHEETIATLEEIIQDLISDRNDLIRIGQAFEQELTGQRIAASDVEYITENIIPIINQLMAAGETDGDSETQRALEAVQSLLSVETVNILQLVGFNFRKAIGEPLTELVAKLISSKAPDLERGTELQTLMARRDIALVNLAQDSEAYERFNKAFRFEA